ncbi:MAG: PilZ domain-containing protein, partial [Candidatus Acidiferrales bacterium]
LLPWGFMNPTLSSTTRQLKSRRRSKRLRLTVPVDVIAFEGETELFREAAHVSSVSAHGGLVVMAAGVAIGQVLRLINRNTREHQDCRVVHVESAQNKWTAGVEFLQPAGNFWQISFPALTSFAQDTRN